MSRKPEFKLKAFNKKDERRGDLGAGWQNADGSVTIQLNPYVVISYDTDTVITLFPAVKKEAS